MFKWKGRSATIDEMNQAVVAGAAAEFLGPRAPMIGLDTCSSHTLSNIAVAQRG
jgi:hypothetical protein